MAQCCTCGKYYKTNKNNYSEDCDTCLYDSINEKFDEEDQIDIESLRNPTGKTQPKFSEE